METTRRGFMGGAAAMVGGVPAANAESEAAGFRLGVASYSFREFQRAPAIRMMKALQTPYLSVKEFHLPYSSTADELARGRKEFANGGMTLVSGGVITLAQNSETDMRRYFDYAKAAGIPMIVCAPTKENVKLLERMTREYEIRAAIHNHGPEDRHFPTPQSVLSAIQDLDPRVGLCMDIGHSTRAGANILESIEQAGPRLLEVHIKDLKKGDDAASQCDVGEGILPIVAMFRLLAKKGFTGSVNLEYEIHADAPLTGMLKSFSYMRGVLAGMKG